MVAVCPRCRGGGRDTSQERRLCPPFPPSWKRHLVHSQISEGPRGPQGLDSGRNLTFSTVVEAQVQRQIWVSRAAFRTRYHWPVVLIFHPSRQASAEPAQATLSRQAAISIGIRGERQATQGQHLISNRLKWTTAGHLRPTTARSRA